MKLDPRPLPRRREARLPEDEEDLVSLRELAARLWRGRWVIVLSAALLAAIAAVVVLRLPDRYVATARVMFAAEKANVVDLKAILDDPAFSKDTLANEIEVLRSTTLIARVVDELDLRANPEFNPELRASDGGALAQLQAIPLPGWLTGFAARIAPPTDRAPAPDPSERERQATTASVLDALTLRPIENTRVIEIAFASEQAATAAAVANAVAGQYLVDQLVAKTETTRAAIDWLARRVEDSRRQVQAAEAAVEHARAELSASSGQGLDISQQQLVALNEALAAARSRTAQAEAQHSRLEAALADSTDLASVSEFRDAPPIAALRETEAAVADRLSGLKPSHPAVRQLRTELADVRARMRAEARAVVAAIGIDVEAARAEAASLGAAVRALETKTLDQSRDDLRLRQLEREADADRLIYETMLNRLKEASEQVELQAANARVLSPAEAPLAPEAGRKALIVSLAGVLGLFAGTALALLLDLLNTTFRTPQQIEQATGHAVLGTVPSLRGRRSRADVLAHLTARPSSSLAESVRNLRTSILFANVDHPPRVVMFTSSLPREGKTTSAMLTALASVQMGKAAIVVDCDLRRSAAAATLAVGAPRLGLLSVLDGSASLDDAIVHDAATGLAVLLSRPDEGRGWLNAADVLASNRFGELVRSLSERYDLVILDTPPTLAVADARILSAISDAAVYVVRWASTPRGAVLEGLRELESVDAPIAGIVLTQLNERKAARQSLGRYVYHRRRFRDYYVD